MRPPILKIRWWPVATFLLVAGAACPSTPASTPSDGTTGGDSVTGTADGTSVVQATVAGQTTATAMDGPSADSDGSSVDDTTAGDTTAGDTTAGDTTAGDTSTGDTTTDDTGTTGDCVPQCGGRECGDNGCGGVCGFCTPLRVCVDGACECDPICDGLNCGPDPICGVSCGECSNDEVCTAGACGCVPECGDQSCGLDPVCGVSCGICLFGDVCIDGECGCLPDCSEQTCGLDPMCGVSCGTCTAAEGLSCGSTYNCPPAGTGTCTLPGPGMFCGNVVGWSEPDWNVPVTAAILGYQLPEPLPQSRLKHFVIESNVGTAQANAIMALYTDEDENGDPDVLVATSEAFQLNGSVYVTAEQSVDLPAGEYWVMMLLEAPAIGLIQVNASESSSAAMLWAHFTTYPEVPDPFVPMTPGGIANYQYSLSIVIEED